MDEGEGEPDAVNIPQRLRRGAGANRPMGAALAAAAAVIVLAVAIPLAAHAMHAHRGRGPVASATNAAPGARLFIEDFAGTGATFYLTGVQVETADGAPLASYQLPAHPPAGAFTVSADGTHIAYLAADGIHVAIAIDGTQDRVVHPLPLDRSQPDPASQSAQLPFANWAVAASSAGAGAAASRSPGKAACGPWRTTGRR